MFDKDIQVKSNTNILIKWHKGYQRTLLFQVFAKERRHFGHV